MSNDYLNQPLSLAPTVTSDDSSSRRGTISLASSASDTPSTASLGVGSSASSFKMPSPYLNYDPRFLQQAQPEFIFPEGASKQRGRFELAFSQIGSSVMVGASIGGLAGAYNGIRATNALQQTGKLWRTQMLNHIMKQGSGTANTLGTLAVLYSAFGVGLQYARGEDDDFNTVIAGTATGLLYKCTAGLRKCALGGGIGLALTSAYMLFNLTQNKKGQTKYGFLS